MKGDIFNVSFLQMAISYIFPFKKKTQSKRPSSLTANTIKMHTERALGFNEVLCIPSYFPPPVLQLFFEKKY